MNKRQSNTISENWVLNKGNIFGLPEDDAIPLSIIHLEILRQTEDKKIDTILDFLNFKIEINKEINSAGDYTIKRIFLEELSVSETYLNREEIEILFVYNLIQLWFFKKLVNQNHPEFLTLDNYKKIFAKRRTDFLDKKNDTIGDDFVKNEIKTCNKVLKELKKPVYNEINYLGEITKEPAPFKEDLTNRINRRLEFLKDPRFTEESLQKLTNKFNHIGFLDYKEVKTETYKYETITSKLDYLKTVKEKHYDKHDQVVSALSVDEKILFIIHRDIIWGSIFGKNSLTTSLKIQEPVYDEFFKEEWNNPEYTYWFLNYNASIFFNLYITREEFESEINSRLKDIFIKAELKKLNDFETKAKNLRLNNELDIYKHPAYKYKKETILLRVIAENYYTKKPITINNSSGLEAQYFFRHLLLKPYLEKLLKEIKNSKEKQTNSLLEDNYKEPQQLKELFADKLKYQRVMEILVSEDLIFETSYSYNKAKKGELASLVMNLHSKGYFLNNDLPHAKIIKQIIKNTFKINVSVSTIEHAKADNFNFKFILHSEKLNNS